MERVIELILGLGPGAAALLSIVVIVILVGAAREWWVWGPMFHREREEKLYWRDKTFEAFGLTDKAVDLAEEVVINGDSP